MQLITVVLLIVAILYCVCDGDSGDPINVAVATIATRNDVLRIDEWIDYHKFLGFGRFYIADHDDMFSHLKIRGDYVSVLSRADVEWSTPKDAFSELVQVFSHEHTLCIFLSVNDFMVLRNHYSIQGLINNVGIAPLLELVTFDVWSIDDVFNPESVLKRSTMRSWMPSGMRYSGLISDITDFDDELKPIVAEMNAEETDTEEAIVVVFSVALLSRIEHRWYVEKLCEDFPSLLGLYWYDHRDYSDICTQFHVNFSTDSDWIAAFDVYYDALRSEYIITSQEDRTAWVDYSSMLEKAKVTSPERNNEVDVVLYKLLFLEPPEEDPSTREVLLSFSQGVSVRGVNEMKTMTLYRDSEAAIQIVQLCMEHQLLAETCLVVSQRVVDMLEEMNANSQLVSVNGISSSAIVDIALLHQALSYYEWIYQLAAPTPYELMRKSLLDSTKLHHPEECFRGWRTDEQMLLLSDLPSVVVYVVTHDDASRQELLDGVYDNGTFAGNGRMVPVTIRSTILLEYIVFKEVLPSLSMEWSNVEYVGIFNYHTILDFSITCTFEIQRLLRVGAQGDYDVIPFARGRQDFMIRSILCHGREFRVAWDALLSALGYEEATIRKYDHMGVFYRSAMLIKPEWLRRLSEFTTRAIEVVETNSTVYRLCSVSAGYGVAEVAERIYNTTDYQLFPFLFERLVAFYLVSEGANVCQGNEECPYNGWEK